jgi:hypothetical protein
MLSVSVNFVVSATVYFYFFKKIIFLKRLHHF